MQTLAPKRASVVIAALFALSCIGLTIFVWLSFGGSVPFSPQGYELRILFPNASNLAVGSDVRIAGVTVGRVVSLSDRRLSTEATITLDQRFVPLPADALAMIRNKTLLGETYVDLTPGTPNAPKLPDDGVLSSRNVQQIQTIDQVLGAFDAPTRARFKLFMHELATSLNGRGTDLNDALGNMAPTAQDLASFSQALDSQRASMAVLLHDGSGVLQQVGDRQADVRSIVTAGNQVLATTAARNRALTGTVNALPAFLTDLRATMRSADRTAGQAAPTLRALLPAAPLLAPALDEIHGLAPNLQATLQRLSPVLTELRPALPALDRVIAQAKPFSIALAAAGRQLDPMLELTKLYRTELVSLFANVADGHQATLPGDTGTPVHYVRGINVFTNEDPFGYSYRPGTNRYNAYLKPGELSSLLRGLPAFNCANAGNPTPIPVWGNGGPPRCHEQGAWKFGGLTMDYPHALARR